MGRVSESAVATSPSPQIISEVVRQQELLIQMQNTRAGNLDVRGLSLTGLFFGAAIAILAGLVNASASGTPIPDHLFFASMIAGAGLMAAALLSAGSALYLRIMPPGFMWAHLHPMSALELNAFLHGAAVEIDRRIAVNMKTLNDAARRQRFAMLLAFACVILGATFLIGGEAFWWLIRDITRGSSQPL